MASDKVVFDTNIWISAFLFNGNPKKAIDLAHRKCQIFCSLTILQELSEVLDENFSLPDKKIEELIGVILKMSQVIPISGDLKNISSDPDDNSILETALASDAHYLVTGDKHLLVLKKYKNIKILQPKDFIEILSQ